LLALDARRERLPVLAAASELSMVARRGGGAAPGDCGGGSVGMSCVLLVVLSPLTSSSCA